MYIEVDSSLGFISNLVSRLRDFERLESSEVSKPSKVSRRPAFARGPQKTFKGFERL